MLYNLLKNLIIKGKFDRDDMTNKLNVFFTFNVISKEEYTKLFDLVKAA